MTTELASAPEWLGAALLGAVLAALGYLCKLALEWLATLRATRRQRVSRLVELHSLLRAGQVAFLVQSQHRDRLAELLADRPPEGGRTPGYESHFATAYPLMSPNERQLHALIRSITVHTIRPLNQALLAWLQQDAYFRAAQRGGGPRAHVAKQLAQLEAHLLLWNAKYEMWMPDDPAHALVYLADEEQHGVGFPPGIQEGVAALLAKRWWFGG